MKSSAKEENNKPTKEYTKGEIVMAIKLISWQEAVKLSKVENVQALKDIGKVVLDDGTIIEFDNSTGRSKYFKRTPESIEGTSGEIETPVWKKVSPQEAKRILTSARIESPLRFSGDIGLTSWRRLEFCNELELRNGIQVRRVHDTVTDKFIYEVLYPIIDLNILLPPKGILETNLDGTTYFRTPTGTELLIQQLSTLVEVFVDPLEPTPHNNNDNEDGEDYEDDEDNSTLSGEEQKTKGLNSALLALKVEPEVYFQFVKSSLSQLQLEDLTMRLHKLSELVRQAGSLGQTAVYEELALQMAGIAKEQEAAAIGCSKRISEKVVKFFISKIEGKTVKFDKFENFPRVVPVEIAAKIKEIQDTKVFDSYKIVYVDYTKEVLTTTEQKIRTKDPILFGCFDHKPEQLYFIVDWVDEYCELTLNKLVEVMVSEIPSFKLDEIPELDSAFIAKTLEDVERRHLRLKSTNQRNYKQLIREEQRDAEMRAEELALKAVLTEEVTSGVPIVQEEEKSWLNRFINIFKK